LPCSFQIVLPTASVLFNTIRQHTNNYSNNTTHTMADRPHQPSKRGGGRDRRDRDAGSSRADREHHRDGDHKQRNRSRSPRDQANRRERRRDDDTERRGRNEPQRAYRERDDDKDRPRDRGAKRDRGEKTRDKEPKPPVKGSLYSPPYTLVTDTNVPQVMIAKQKPPRTDTSNPGAQPPLLDVQLVPNMSSGATSAMSWSSLHMSRKTRRAHLRRPCTLSSEKETARDRVT
jgi:hypothetical protein